MSFSNTRVAYHPQSKVRAFAASNVPISPLVEYSKTKLKPIFYAKECVFWYRVLLLQKRHLRSQDTIAVTRCHHGIQLSLKHPYWVKTQTKCWSYSHTNIPKTQVFSLLCYLAFFTSYAISFLCRF